MTKVGVIGAHGRMGSLACAAVEEADDLELVARVGSADPLDLLAGVDVAVDLTRPEAVLDNVEWCVTRGIHVVVGTSGVTADRLERIGDLLRGATGVGVAVIPNFSIGAVLMTRFAAQAAPYFESVEIVELHHPDKRDAPSGTATTTASKVAAARQQAGLGPASAPAEELPAARGQLVDGIPVHSVRLRGLVAHQEVLLGAPGEVLTIRHDSIDRASFMPGLLAAVRAVVHRSGLTVGLDSLIDL